MPRARRRRRGTALAHGVIHRPLTRRLGALVLAGLAGLLAAGAVARADQRAAAFGELTEVAVATRHLDVGHEVEASDLDHRHLPLAVLPAGTVADPVGRVVTAGIEPGEPLLDARLAPAGRSGPAALLSDGQHAVAVPLDGPSPPLHPGDAVDLLAPSGSESGARDVVGRATGQATVVARGATVVALDERAVTVAVRDGDLVATARAVLDGAVLVMLSPP